LLDGLAKRLLGKFHWFVWFCCPGYRCLIIHRLGWGKPLSLLISNLSLLLCLRSLRNLGWWFCSFLRWNTFLAVNLFIQNRVVHSISECRVVN
jgi:hypothetical protein